MIENQRRCSQEGWFRDFAPDLHFLANGATGGWTVRAETMTGGKYELEFRNLPTVDQLYEALGEEIRKRVGVIV